MIRSIVPLARGVILTLILTVTALVLSGCPKKATNVEPEIEPDPPLTESVPQAPPVEPPPVVREEASEATPLR